MTEFPEPPEGLAKRDIWIIWKLGYREGMDPEEDDPTKIPLDPVGGYNASATDPSIRTDFETAVEAFEKHDEADGVGFAFPRDDLLVGIDLDDVRDPETGELTEWADRVVTDFDSYTEVSPSGTGVHIIVYGLKPGERCRTSIDDGRSEVEMYSQDRFFTYTGETIRGLESIEQRKNQVSDLYEEAFGDEDEDEPGVDVEPPDLDLDDEEILRKARSAKNSEKFEALWRGRSWSGLDENGGQSERDLALCTMLAFWTGGDRQQIDDLFRQSNLMRPKWDEDRGGDTYGEKTIAKALSRQTEFYEPDNSRSRPPEFEPEPEVESGGVETTDTETAAGEDPHTDGGTAAQNAAAAVAGDESGEADAPRGRTSLDPLSVMAEAQLDEDDDLMDLLDREKAYRVWSIVERGDDHHFLAAQPDGTIFCYEDGVWQDEGEQRLREITRPALGPAYSRNVLTEMSEQVRAAAPRPRSALGAPRGTVAVRNGLLELDSGELRELTAEDYATFQVDADYDPEAECPKFQSFVSDVVREGDLETLQEYAGYCLLHWGQPYKRAILLLGPQDSGKSTFLNVLKDILGGSQNVSAENLNSLVNTRWGTASLFGKVANITNELETKKLQSLGLFKTITGGGDEISAELKGKDKFDFEPTAKQLFATNQVPPTSNTDDAFFSRWVFASFPVSVPVHKQVANLDDKMLAEERSGILNWMIEGYRRLQDQGGFTNDPLSGRKRERWEAYGDSIERFKHNCLQVTGDSNDAVAKSIAHSLYSVYCKDKIGSEVKPQQTLTQELKKDDKIGESKRKLHPDDQRRKVYTGIRYHSDALEALNFDPGARLEEMRRSGEDVEDDEDEGGSTTSLSGFGEE